MDNKLLFFLVFLTFLGIALPVSAQNEPVIHFFYSKTCPHCAAEASFLDGLKEECAYLQIERHLISDPESQELITSFYEEHGVEKQERGLVPATFVGEHYFIGFSGEGGTGELIRKAAHGELENDEECADSLRESVNLPFVGEIDVGKYSLPALTVLMGVLDGFNVCSLGALVLILGLVLNLKSRGKILIYGGLFVLITAVIYGILIVLWYRLFSLLSNYLRAMEVLIGALAFFGGIYFLKEFMKFRKYGPACESNGAQIGKGLLENVKDSISDENVNPLALAFSILLFAGVLTVVEFPCSAAVPVVYAGVLAEADLPSLAFILYIAFFVLFYMLDELIVFGVAVWKMDIWMSSPKFTTWVTLVQSIILFGLSAFYLIGL